MIVYMTKSRAIQSLERLCLIVYHPIDTDVLRSYDEQIVPRHCEYSVLYHDDA